MEQLTLNGFLLWAASAAGSSIIGSFILEKLSWFQKLASESKRWVFFGVCSFLSVGAYSILTYAPAEFLSAVAPFFGLVATVFISVFAGEKYHEARKEPEEVW